MFFKIFLYEWIKIFGVKNFATSPIEFLTQFVRVYLICPRMFRTRFFPSIVLGIGRQIDIILR